MFSCILKVGLLAACLVAAGNALAADRRVVVPVLAGAPVGALLSNSSDDRHRHQARHHYRPPPPRHYAHYPQHAPRAVKRGYYGKQYVLVPVERHGHRGGCH